MALGRLKLARDKIVRGLEAIEAALTNLASQPEELEASSGIDCNELLQIAISVDAAADEAEAVAASATAYATNMRSIATSAEQYYLAHCYI